MKVLLISSRGNDGVGVNDDAIDDTVVPLKLYLKTRQRRLLRGGYWFLSVKILVHINDCLRLFNVLFCLKHLRKTNSQKYIKVCWFDYSLIAQLPRDIIY